MKNLFFKSALIGLLCACCGLFSSCKEEVGGPSGDFSLSVKKVGADYVELAVDVPAAMEIAYKLTTSPTIINAPVLFATGKVMTVNPGQLLTIRDNVVQDTKYYLYAAAKLDEQNYSEIQALEFTTTSYEFSDLVTLVETYNTGYKVHITVPESAKKAGNVIRYGSTSLAWYNLMKNSKGGESTDLNAVVANGNPYGNYVKNDSTIVMDDWNVVLLDENGVPVLDSDGQQIDIHDPIAPGEPTIFLAGECRWGTPDEFAEIMGYNLPERSAYIIPLYDWKSGWTGAFQKIEFFAKEPVPCEQTVQVDIPEDEITVTDAMIYFTMDEGVSGYFYMVLDNATYNQVLGTYLDGHEEWWQWFLTSYIAFYEWGVYQQTENVYTNAASSFVEPLTGGETYHVLVTVLGNEEGSEQQFVHKTFKAKEKTKRAPVVTVTALEENDPFSASFNVKAPNKDLLQAYWACNYAREFELKFNAGYSYSDILKGNYYFSSDDIAKINSDAGLDVSFPTLDGEVTRLAVYGYNDEYTFNNIDEDTPTVGWDDYNAPLGPVKEPVSSSLFEELAGDWTATATVIAKEVSDDETVVSYNHEHKSKVTISNTAPVLPDAVDEYVYDLYDSKDEVDGMFEELQILTDQFTEHRLAGQNRLLCNGFIDFDYYKDPGRLTYRSPYELFTATNYSSIDVPQLIYDFGPKWFLEVLPDGSVIVPFDSMFMPPMHNWPGYPFYVGGVGDGAAFYDATDKYPGFPVEISEDRETIIIKPIVLVDDAGVSHSYYMNALGLSPQSAAGELEIVAAIVTEIVLERGWTEPESPAKSFSAVPSSVKAVNMDGSPVTELPKVRTYRSLTPLNPAAKVEYKLDETPDVVTMDMVNRTSEKILKYYNLY